MMLRRVTPESAIAFTKLSLVISLSWPLPATATKWQVIRFTVLRVLTYVNIGCLLMPMLLLLEDFATRTTIVIKSAPLIAGFIQILVAMGICDIQYKRLQSVIAEMESYCKRAKDSEKAVLQQYVDRCATFYAAIVTWFYSTAVQVICSPPLSSEPFPTYAKYPFDVDSQPLKTIIYVQQSSVGLQLSSILCVNVLVALLLWFTTARFDILSNELRKVSTVNELIQCIQTHQQLLRYADDVTQTVRFLVLSTMGANVIAVVFSGVVFVSRQPLIIKVQFFMITLTSLSEVFTCCWPADNLLSISSDIAQAIYESLWYNQNISKQKNLILILLRCQKKPVIITIACFIPVLSLNYFGSFVSSGFSYITTLRVMMKDNETTPA